MRMFYKDCHTAAGVREDEHLPWHWLLQSLPVSENMTSQNVTVTGQQTLLRLETGCLQAASRLDRNTIENIC